MLEMMRSKLKRTIERMGRIASPRHFLRRNDGAAAVEFAIVVLPFLAIMLGIMQTALVFFADQALETMVTDGARLIMTGQAQNNGWDVNAFKNAVCPTNGTYGGLITCNNLSMNIRTFPDFGSISYTPPTPQAGQTQIDTSGFVYQPGSPGTIVIVQFFYQWPITVDLLGLNALATSGLGNSRLLVATAAFRNEPY
jgi:Flp pilus assembly protein TadG